MTPCSFEQSNCVLGRPTSMSAEQCDPLSVFRGIDGIGRSVIISCFKLTQDELEEFQRTGRIWLWIVGQTMPPVALTAENPWKN